VGFPVFTFLPVLYLSPNTPVRFPCLGCLRSLHFFSPLPPLSLASPLRFTSTTMAEEAPAAFVNTQRQGQLENEGWKLVESGEPGLVKFQRRSSSGQLITLWLCAHPDCAKEGGHKGNVLKHAALHRRDEEGDQDRTWACTACHAFFESRQILGGHVRWSQECRVAINGWVGSSSCRSVVSFAAC
jgi:hypothetical protein